MRRLLSDQVTPEPHDYVSSGASQRGLESGHVTDLQTCIRHPVVGDLVIPSMKKPANCGAMRSCCGHAPNIREEIRADGRQSREHDEKLSDCPVALRQKVELHLGVSAGGIHFHGPSGVCAAGRDSRERETGCNRRGQHKQEQQEATHNSTIDICRGAA
jgi:hypothetical protein